MHSIPVNVFRDPSPEVVFNIADKDLTFIISLKQTGKGEFTLTISDTLILHDTHGVGVIPRSAPYGGVPKRTPALDTAMIVERDLLDGSADERRIKKEAHKRYIEQIAYQAFGPKPNSEGLDIQA